MLSCLYTLGHVLSAHNPIGFHQRLILHYFKSQLHLITSNGDKKHHRMSFRWALSQYIQHPENYADIIKYQDKDFVLIEDAFPKSIIHWLLLPRDPFITKQNPLTIFKNNEELHIKVIELIPKIKDLILKFLEREFSLYETTNFIKVGVHSVPSMNNLHIHFITKDLSTPRMKNKIHYNSFTTEFFVPFDDLPLKDNDERLNKKAMELLEKKADMVCIYCGKNYYNKFADLKKHIDVEWRKYKAKREIITID